MYIVLQDDPVLKKQLYPLTMLKPIWKLRIGILTIEEKWRQISKLSVETKRTDKFPKADPSEYITINSSVLPDRNVWETIKSLSFGQELVDSEGVIIASFGNETLAQVLFEGKINSISRPWHISQLNATEIIRDFSLVTSGRKTNTIDDKGTIIYGDKIFIEKGATITASSLNSTTGPIYIGKNARLEEGSIVRGPFAACESSTIKIGAKIRENNTIGPHCKVGGEMSNSVIQGYSNKSHDGFMGDSVIGEWCNLGADTNISNLKNNYSLVRSWSYAEESMIDTGLQFSGLIMGDHSKCAINTMFNTGTVVGTAANIFGAGFPPKFIPSFTWGGIDTLCTYEFEKALLTIQKSMHRKRKQLNSVDIEFLRIAFDKDSKFRDK